MRSGRNAHTFISNPVSHNPSSGVKQVLLQEGEKLLVRGQNMFPILQWKEDIEQNVMRRRSGV